MSSVLVTVLTLDSGFFEDADGVVTKQSSFRRPEDAAVFPEAGLRLSRVLCETSWLSGREVDTFEELATFADAASWLFSHPCNPALEEILRFLRGGSERKLWAAFSMLPGLRLHQGVQQH